MIDDPQIHIPGTGKRPVSRWRTMMSGQPYDVQRQGFRFRTGVLAEVEDDGQTYTCEAQNISRSGVLLVGDFPVPSADMVNVRLGSPTGGKSGSFKGKVIRVQRDNDGP